MSDDMKIPRSVKIVAYLFLFGGICSVIDIIVALTRGLIYLNLGVLGIPIFFGLLNRRNGWRVCAMVFLWIGFIVIPIVFLMGLVGDVPGYFEVFRIKVARIPSWVTSVASIPIFFLILWQYRVLMRPEIKALFKPSDV